MKGFESIPQEGFGPEKKDKEKPSIIEGVIKDVGEKIDEKLGEKIKEKTGVDVEKVKKVLESWEPPIMHAAEGGAEQKEKGTVEKILENPKAVRAGAAITLAALKTWAEFWFGVGDITPGFMKTEKEKREIKKLKKRGGLECLLIVPAIIMTLAES